MTPKRRDLFFLSLRQLEQRLASESSPPKKIRLAKCKESAHTQPAPCIGLAANSFSNWGLSDSTHDTQAIIINDFILADVNATSTCALGHGTYASKCEAAGATATLCVLADVNAVSECGLAHDADASTSGLAGAHATLGCVLPDVDATSECDLAHDTDVSKCGLAGVNTTSRCALPDANTLSQCGLRHDIDASKCGLAGANVTLRCILADANVTSNCGFTDALTASRSDANSGVRGINITSIAGANATLRCRLNATSSSPATSTCRSVEVNSVTNTEQRGVKCTSNRGLAGDNSPSRCGLVVAGLHTQASNVVNLEPSKPDVDLAGTESMQAYPRLAKALDAGSYLKPAEVGLTDICRTQNSTLFNIQHVGADVRDVDHVCTGSGDNAEVQHRYQCISCPSTRIFEDNDAHEMKDELVSGDAGPKNDDSKYDMVHQGGFVTSRGDSVHTYNAVDFAHGRDSLDLVTLCEDEERMYNAIFSGENEDSVSVLELSACWNPCDIHRHSGEFDSHPPAEFLSTPMTNNTVDMTQRKTPESSTKSFCQELQEREGDGIPDLTLLCALLGLDDHTWLPKVNDASPALHTNKILASDENFHALHHELPGSTFYINVAKVGENRFQHAEALDSWLQRLSQSQMEPYCHALLLMAKASLQKNKDKLKSFSCEFPSIIEEWLALQHDADQQEVIES